MAENLVKQFQEAQAATEHGRLDQAGYLYADLFSKLPPDHEMYPTVGYNLSWFEFREGQFGSGHKHRIECGRKLGIIHNAKNKYHQPRIVERENLNGQTVLISSECGAGDEIVLSRYVRCLKDLGAEKIIWLSRQGLASVMSRVRGVDLAITEAELTGMKFDRWIFALDLLLLFGDNPRKDEQPYIQCKDEFRQKFSRKLQSQKKLKVGLRWRGDTERDVSLQRAIPLKYFEMLTDIPGIDFYSLQRDFGADELRSDSKIVNWAPDLTTWEDTLGAIANLDVVITSCTSVAHAAAAMGITTFVVCQEISYYTWSAKDKYRSHWYKSAIPFTRSIRGTWETPMLDVRKFLIDITLKHASSDAGNLVTTVHFPKAEMQMAVHNRPEMVSQIILGQKYYTRRDLSVFDALLKPGDTFVDVGANLGWYSMYASQCVGPKGKVVAIEPAPENLECLRKTVELNNLKQIEVLPTAVGDTEGETWLYTCKENSGDHAMSEGNAALAERPKVRIPVNTLDAIFEQKKLQPRLIKMDIQGAEAAALQGLEKYLQKNRPYILLEFAPGLINRYGSSPFEIFAFLENYKYIPVWVPDEYSPANDLKAYDISSLFNFVRENRMTEVGLDFLFAPFDEVNSLQIRFTRGIV